MTGTVRAALLQAKWTGDAGSMVETAVRYADTAAADGVGVLCFQELFNGPYFCQVQDPGYYALAEPVPERPTTRLMCEVARRTGMVLVVPLYEEEQPGVTYNTAAVIDADGTYLGK